MSASDISVVMGTYNGARFIREQLQTILDQQQRPREIIVADDGSSDDTLAIVEQVATESAEVDIRIHRNSERLGFADNFLNACAQATGRFIAFSDQDDRWYPEKLRVSRDALLAEQAVLCVHAVDDIDPDGAFVRRNDQHIRERRVQPRLTGNPWDVFYGFTMLFEKSLLDRIDSGRRGKDVFSPGQPLSHDRWVYFLASCFGRVVTVPDSLAGYRQHGGQLYGGPPERSLARRVADKFRLGAQQLGYFSEVAQERIDMLTPLAAAGDSDAASALDRWSSFHDTLTTSAQLWTEPKFGRRLALWARNVRRGGYRSLRRGGLGPQYLAEDVAVMCLLPLAGRFRRHLVPGPEVSRP